MRILVTGATGYTGRQVVMNLAAQGHRVRALVRDHAAFDWLAFGPRVEAWVGDALQPKTLVGIDQGCEVVVNTIGGGVAGGEAGLDRVMVQTVQNLVGALRPGKLQRFVHVSHLAVYGRGQATAVTAETPPAPVGPVGRAALRAEEWLRRQAASTGLPLVVVRPGMIYGPFRTFAEPLRQGKVRLIGGGRNRLGRIYVDDLAAVLTAAALRGRAGTLYNAVDDDCATAREFFALVAAEAGVKAPRLLPVPVARLLTGFAQVMTRLLGHPGVLGPAAIELATLDVCADNRGLQDELGVTLQYPSFRQGVPAALRVEREAQ